MSKRIEMIGKKFGRLTVLEATNKRKCGCIVYKCLCECGTIKYINGKLLRSGETKSCGCLNLDNHFKHGKRNTRLYNIFSKMKTRCYKPYDKHYKDYGGRGINICDEWLNDFMTFYNWAIINGYKDNLTIDRIDVNGNYEPSNCRWVTMKEQNNNTRKNASYTYNGKTQTLKQWAEEYNLNYAKLKNRRRLGWNIKDILFGKGNKYELQD